MRRTSRTRIRALTRVALSMLSLSSPPWSVPRPQEPSELVAPGLDEVSNPCHEGLNRHAAQVVSRAPPYGHRPFLLFPRTHHQHVRDLLHLRLADLEAHLLVRGVDLDPQACRRHRGADLLAVGQELLGDPPHARLRP